jgi:hypothetical protein
VQTDATRTCELLVGLRDVTVLGVDERLRQPLEVCVDPQHPGSIALSRSQKVQVPLFDAVPSKWGMPPKRCYTGATTGASTEARPSRLQGTQNRARQPML